MTDWCDSHLRMTNEGLPKFSVMPTTEIPRHTNDMFNKDIVYQDRKNDQSLRDVQENVADSYEEYAPDGGWGWIVTFAAFMVDLLSSTVKHSFGVMYSLYFEKLRTPHTTVSLIFNAAFVFSCTITFLVGPVIQEFGWRAATITSGFLYATGMILSAFATSPLHTFLCFSVISGMNLMFLTCIAYTITQYYFTTKRTFANAVVTSGYCVSQFVMPMVITSLHQHFGFKGSTIILGGIMFNICAAAMVFHPVEWHVKIPPKTPAKTSNDGGIQPEPLFCNDGEIHPKCSTATKISKTEEDIQPKLLMNTTKTSMNDGQINPKLITKDKISTNQGEIHPKLVTTTKTSMDEEIEPKPFKTTAKRTTESSHEDVSQKNDGHTQKRFSTIKRLAKTALGNILLLKSPVVTIITIALSINYFVLDNVAPLVPFAMMDKGFTEEDAAICLTVCGACNLISKLFLALFNYYTRIKVLYMYIVGSIISAVSVIAFSLMESQLWRAITLGMYGFAASAVISFTALLVVEQLGLDMLLPVTSITMLVNAVIMLIFGYVLGETHDLSGSYVASLNFLSTSLLISEILWLFLPAAKASDLRRKKKQEMQEEEQIEQHDVNEWQKSSPNEHQKIQRDQTQLPKEFQIQNEQTPILQKFKPLPDHINYSSIQ